MFFSRYNVVEKFDDTTVIYNTLSSAILKLDGDYSKYLHEIIENKSYEKEDLVQALINGGMIYKEQIDELKMIKVSSLKSRYNSKILSYTIAPTMSCNFKCDYCFEAGKRYNTMSEETMEDTINFIVKDSLTCETINISWYGGEPLLAIKQIQKISNGIMAKINNNIKFISSMVTNGYLLSRENAIILKEIGVKRVQITLDGSKESHDKRRILLNGEGSFNKIIDNIKNCYDLLDINIRVNLDKRNSNEYIEVLEELEKANLKNKVSIYIAPVDNINDTAQCTTGLNEYEFADNQDDFYRELKNRNFKLNNKISTKLGVCGAVSDNSILIDPLGDLYKCWNDIAYKDKNIGHIKAGISMNNEYLRWMDYDPMKRKVCLECTLLPVCMGGCPHSALNNINKCTSKKHNLRKVLENLCFM